MPAAAMYTVQQQQCSSYSALSLLLIIYSPFGRALHASFDMAGCVYFVVYSYLYANSSMKIRNYHGFIYSKLKIAGDTR